jgi:hypothetical protein
MLVYLRQVYLFCHALEFTADIKYRNYHFKAFIEAENIRFYTNKNIVLVGGE